MRLAIINDHHSLSREAADWSLLPSGVTLPVHGRVSDAEAPALLAAHIGGRTRENFLARYRDALEDVLAFLEGKPIRVV